MSRPQRYQYPQAVDEVRVIEVSDKYAVSLIQGAVSKYAARYRRVFRTRWDGKFMYIRRAA